MSHISYCSHTHTHTYIYIYILHVTYFILFTHTHTHIYIYIYIYITCHIFNIVHTHTHTHTHMYIYIYYMSSKVTLYNTFNNSDCQSTFTVFNMKNSLIAFFESVISNIEFSICQCDLFFSDSYPVAHLSDLWHLNQWPWIKASVGQESDFPMPSCFKPKLYLGTIELFCGFLWHRFSSGNIRWLLDSSITKGKRSIMFD